MEQNKTLNLNIYEIRIDENFVTNKDLIDTFLFECQCALFLVDITNKDSFELIKKLISNIEFLNLNILKKFLCKINLIWKVQDKFLVSS